MRNVIGILFLFVIIISGCNNTNPKEQMITEEKAMQLIIDKRSRECCGDVEIIEVTSKPEKYIIHWEIDPIEMGTDSINKQTGHIKMIESSRGSCKWK